MNVVINGKPMDIKGTKLYYQDICELAGVNPERIPTITYEYRRSGIGGSVTPNDDDGVYLDPEHPTIFDCMVTGNA